MTQEEKQLLWKDLCARLPYEPKARKGGMETSINLATLDSFYYVDEIILPYLRSMSSMTEEEMGEYAKFKLSFDNTYEFTDFKATGKGFINVHTSCKYGGCGYTFQVNNKTMLYDGIIGIDWLNKKHFDYRGLIPKGLAIKASEEMYNF